MFGVCVGTPSDGRASEGRMRAARQDPPVAVAPMPRDDDARHTRAILARSRARVLRSVSVSVCGVASVCIYQAGIHIRLRAV